MLAYLHGGRQGKALKAVLWAAMVSLLLAAGCRIVPVTAHAEYRVTFMPKLSLAVEYTDNSALAAEDADDALIALIAPGFDLTIDGKSKGCTVAYEPEASFYKDDSQSDTLRQSLAVDAWLEPSPITRLEIYDRFKRTEEPFGTLYEGTEDARQAVETDTTRRKNIAPYNTNEVGFSLARQISQAQSVTVGYAYAVLENEDPDVTDNARHSPRIDFSHQFSPYLDIATNLAYTRGLFDGPTDDFNEWTAGLKLTRRFTEHFSGNVRYTHTWMAFDGTTEDYQIFDPSFGIGYIFGEDAKVSLNIGYFVQDRQGGDDETGVSVDGNLGKTWQFKRGRITARATSGYDQSYFGAENLGFTTFYQAAGGGTYLLSRSTATQIAASYRVNDYVNQTDDRTDKLMDLTAGLTYVPVTLRWLKLTLSYRWLRMDSSDNANDYDANQIEVSVTVVPTRPFRL